MELGALVEQRREVAHDVVDGDAGGEGDASLEVLALLARESLLHLFFDHGVDRLADGGDVGPRDRKLDGLREAR